MATENGGIWSKKSDGTYEYKVEGTLVATLKNLEDSNVIINETTGEIVSRTKVDENEVAIPLVEVNGTTITLKRDALTSTTELVNGTGSSYELALDDDCEATDSTKWVEGGTGFILRSITTDSYELAEGNLKVTYASAVDGENIATIKGFSATVKDGTITGVEVDVTEETITITDDAVLGDSDVTITQEANYKFVLDGDFASKITDTWTYSNNTANFKSEVSNGYAVTDGGTKISTTTGGTYTAKITGLDTETVTDNDGKVTGITGITVEDNVISVASSAIKAGSSVALTSNYYTIKLADETEVTPEWSVSKGTATFDKNYKTGNLATKADGKAITYYTKDTAVTVAKITGLKTDLTNDTIGGVVEAKDDGTIAVSREAFATDKSIALTSDAYTKLVPMDGGNWDVVVSDPAMTVASGKVTVKTDYSAGWAYKTTTNSKTKVTTTDYKNLVLTKAVTTTDATVSGLPSKIGKDPITYTVGTTDDDKNALYVGTTKVLEFTAPIEANEETGTAAAAGKITLYPGAFSNSPSSLKLDAKNNYNFEFATGVDKNGEAIDETEEWSPAPKTVGAHWKTDGKGKALIVSGTTAGYDFATNKDNTPNYKTVNAIKESYTTAATISGLPSYSSNDSSGVPAGDYYDGSSDVIDEGSILAGLTITSEPTDTAKGVITISNTDLLSLLLKTDGTSSGKKVSLAKNDNYEFKFATDEEDESVINEPEESAPEWVVDKKNGKATYQADVSAGYVISGGKEISYSNAVDDKKIVEVTGLDKTKLAAIAEFNYDGDKATVSKEDFAKYMTVSGNTVTVNSDAFLSATTKLSDKSYTFAVGEDYEDENGYEVKVDIVKAGTETTDLQWVVSGTTAKLYNGGGAAGYEVNAKGELVYKAATVSDDKLLATITGLKKGISASDFTAENIEINSEAGLITLKGTTLLGTTTVAITSDNYNIGVSGVETSETKNAYWSASSGTATYKQKTTAGYTVVNGKSITYAAKDAIATLATIKGLSKDLTDNNIDQYVSTGSDGTITIKSDVALTTSNVTLTGTGYKLALAENVTQSKADATVTEFVTSKGTATYKTYDKSWYTKTNDTTITTTKETAGTTHATIKGLNTAITNAQANEYIHVEDGVITIDEGALVAEPTSKTIIQLTNGKNADNTVAKYTLALSKQNVVYNTPTFTANTKGTAALLVSTVETAGYDTSTDGLKLTYMPEKVNDKDNSVTLATVSNAKADGLEVDTETNVITVNEAALDKKKISLGKNDPYTFALGGYFGATISDEKWSTSGTTATLKGKTSDSYTLTDSKNIACTLGTEGTNKDTTLATIKGVGKGKEVAEADFDDENKVVTLTADLLTTAGASGKADSISTSVAVDSAYGYEFDFEAEFAGSESKASSITGGANSDNIKVEGSYLIINAKAGDDIIDLGTAGNNTFVYAVKDGNDVIADFTTGSDKIKINTKDAQVTLSNGDADAVLTITDKSGKNEGTITLTGMAGQIQKGDIINSTGADIDFATANLSELIAESNAGVYGNYNTNQDYTSLASQQQQTIAYSGDK